MKEGNSLFLLRAFGDFLIALTMASRNRLSSPVTLIASKHLEPLYEALSVTFPPNIDLQFRDFRIRNTIFSCFTDRFILHPHTITELLALRRYVRQHPVSGDHYLENRRRLFLPAMFTGYPFRYVVGGQHVYSAYADFFSVDKHELEDIPFTPRQQGGRVLVIPSARQPKRVISGDIIQKILRSYGTDNEVTIAWFKERENSFAGNEVVYKDFAGLAQLVADAGLVIGSDSMPVHMAQFFSKPHYILHPESVKDRFFTPFSLKHGTHITFEAIANRKSFLPDE
jgi:ADP-heptose:LPS heptosyltransferase